MRAITIMVLWTWGLTPVWVNVVGTIILGLGIICETLEEWAERL